MEKTRYTGKEVTVRFAPYQLFAVFNDMSRIGDNLPPDLKDSVVCDHDSINITKGGFTLGIKRGECIPFSKLSLESKENSPIDFELIFNISPEGTDSSRVIVEMDVELNMMMKMMIGSKLQEVVDKLTFYLGDISEDVLNKLREQNEQLYS